MVYRLQDTGHCTIAHYDRLKPHYSNVPSPAQDSLPMGNQMEMSHQNTVSDDTIEEDYGNDLELITVPTPL